MLTELESILESSGVSTQKEVLHAMKDRIRWQTNRYIERYCNLKSECQICGTHDDVQYHHVDYSQPLKINVLCRACHNGVHNHNWTTPQPIDLQSRAIKEKSKNNRISPLKLSKVEIPDNYLKRLRKQKGLSCAEVGELMGVSGSTIRNWEKGKSLLRRDAMGKYAKVFNVPLENIQRYILEIIENTA